MEAKTRAFYGPGSGDVVWDRVDCVGNEDRLADCSRANTINNNCVHTRDAGVVCEREY